MSEPKALTFDVFGTVVDWRTSIAREGRAFGARHGIDADWERFADDWRGLYQPSMSRVREGERPWTSLDELHRESLCTLLGALGVAIGDGGVATRRSMSSTGRGIASTPGPTSPWGSRGSSDGSFSRPSPTVTWPSSSTWRSGPGSRGTRCSERRWPAATSRSRSVSDHRPSCSGSLPANA